VLTLDIRTLTDVVEQREGSRPSESSLFSEGLARLVADVQSQDQLTLAGRRLLQSELIRLITQRSRFERRVRVFSEARFPQSMIITGWPRTKSTLLHNALADSGAYDALPLYRSLAPFEVSKDQARRDAVAHVGYAEALSPSLALRHPMAAEKPEECITLMQLTGVSDRWSIALYVPEYRRWCERPDIRLQGYEDYMCLLASVLPPGRRIVLKAPTHAPWIELLLETWKDDRPEVVWLSRNERDAIASFEGLVLACRQVFLSSCPADDWADAWRELSPPSRATILDWADVEGFAGSHLIGLGLPEPEWGRYGWLRPGQRP